MITNQDAMMRKTAARTNLWNNEELSSACVRLDQEIRKAADCGADGVSLCFAPLNIPILKAICKGYGFTVNDEEDNFRLSVRWQENDAKADPVPEVVAAPAAE